MQPIVQVALLNAVHVLLGAVACAAHIADYIPGQHGLAHLQALGKGPVLAQMGVIVVPQAVKAAYTHPPASVLVPAQGLHHPGLHRDDRRAHSGHHVVAQVAAAVAILPADPEVVIIAVRKGFGNGRIGF